MRRKESLPNFYPALLHIKSQKIQIMGYSLWAIGFFLLSIGNYPLPASFGIIIALQFSVMKRKVIIIDDNPDQRAVLKGLLTDIGCDVISEGNSGLEAVELMQQLSPDAILMDIKMPGMDGIEAVTAINQLKPTPVIIMTGKKDEETLKRAKGLLMAKEGLTEKDAFSRIQKISMDRRRPMKEIAEILITALEGKGR